MRIIKLFSQKPSDADYVRGIANNDDEMEGKLYLKWFDYFEDKCHKLFINITKEDKKDIRQEAFETFRNKIKDGDIRVKDDKVMYKGNPLNCKLMTFLTSIAINMKRELVRKNDILKYWDDIYDSTEEQTGLTTLPEYLNSEEEKIKLEIIAKCISKMPKRCIEILTMFYYKEMSLDDILQFYIQSGENLRSKDALKTRKNTCMNTLRNLANEQYSQLGS